MKKLAFLLFIIISLFINGLLAQRRDSTFTDARDGKKYKTVKIGNQTWMAENLNFKTDTGSWCYKNKRKNCLKYGRLYNWETATAVCPNGWHLPSDAEWTSLFDYLDGEKVAGGKMKEAGTEYWRSPNRGADNSSGFTALPGGYRDYDDGSFHSLGYNASYWSSTEYGGTDAWDRALVYGSASMGRYYFSKMYDFSVRCLKD
jgi:uncharacterized protein (TIGR02145 family)